MPKINQVLYSILRGIKLYMNPKKRTINVKVNKTLIKITFRITTEKNTEIYNILYDNLKQTLTICKKNEGLTSYIYSDHNICSFVFDESKTFASQIYMIKNNLVNQSYEIFKYLKTPLEERGDRDHDAMNLLDSISELLSINKNELEITILDQYNIEINYILKFERTLYTTYPIYTNKLCLESSKNLIKLTDGDGNMLYNGNNSKSLIDNVKIYLYDSVFRE